MKRAIVRALHRLPPPVRRMLRRLPGAARLRRTAMGQPRSNRSTPGTLRPVVYLPTWLTWDGMRQRPQYLLTEFAASGHPTYFVDPRAARVRSTDGVTIVPSLAEVPGDHPLLYVHFAPLAPSSSLFQDPVIVYDILDDLTIYDADEIGMPQARRVRSHHPRVMGLADVVIASSRVLVDRHLAERGDTLLIENGVDAARFAAPVAPPSDLVTGRPLIGYHGAVAPWFDFDLFEAVATRNPQWSFALVGPVARAVEDRASRLAALGNVTLIGERSSASMPAYVQAFDVGAIWFVVDRLTEGVSPLKMFECLAAGKPVVATPLPACVAVPEVVTASTPDEWGRALAAALESQDDGSRRAAAEAATWSARLEPLLAHLDRVGLRRVPG